MITFLPRHYQNLTLTELKTHITYKFASKNSATIFFNLFCGFRVASFLRIMYKA